MDKICATIPKVVAERCPEMEEMAQAVASKHGKALLLFSKCHQQFNSQSMFTPEMLSSLGKLYTVFSVAVLSCGSLCLESNINEFLSHYRAAFPTATITPKLHMIEDHVVDFISQWRVGFGMMGEQGAESIHAVFNQLHRTYANMTNKVERLKSITTEHHRQICPENTSCRVPPAKRKRLIRET